LSLRQHFPISIIIHTLPGSLLLLPCLFECLLLLLGHVGLDPAHTGLYGHVMLGGEATLILPLLCVLLLPLLLLPQLLERNYVLTLLLIDQLVHLLLYSRLHVSLVELLRIHHH
jgi:hypothetical protein